MRTLISSRPGRSSSRQRGLGVIELMVGLAVGMLLVAGLALMFGNATRSSLELEKTVRHIENGRYAIELLTEDISLAGFYGTVPVTTYAAGLPPCATSADVATDLASQAGLALPTVPFPIEGVYPGLATNLGCMTQRRAGTPALILRRLDTATTAVGAVAADTVYVQTSHYSPDNFYTYKASATATGFNLRNISGAVNPVRRFITRGYYIASCSDCTGGGDGIPTLTRVEVIGNRTVVTPLAEGIEQVGFDYGFDTTGDGVADEWYGLNGNAGASEYAAASTGARGWGKVVAVRIALVSRNIEPTAGHTDTRTFAMGRQGTTELYTTAANDNFKRRGYVTTVRLQTVAGLKEAP